MDNNIKKKKNPFIIILIIILIILAIVIGVTSILLLSNKEVEEKDNSTTSKTTRITSTLPIEGAIFDKNNIGIKVSSINMNNVYDDTKAISIAFSIINNNTYTALPTFTEFTINGNSITDTRLILDIKASEDEEYGIKAYNECNAILYIDKGEYNSYNIKEIESITFKLSISNEDSWKKTVMLEKELVTINKEDITYNNSQEYPEKLVYNQNNIKLYYVQVTSSDVRFYIENNTNQDINIKAFDVYVDNNKQDGDFWNISLPKGKKKYSQIFTSETYLYSISDIKDFRLKLIVSDKDNKELFRTNEIKVIG